MASSVWTRSIDEAHDNPYQHEEQALFLAEAKRVLDGIRTVLRETNMKFHRDDTSREKAVWMLHFDVLDALFDVIFLFRNARPQSAGRLFRDVIETLDLAAHFVRLGQASTNDLVKWYSNQVVQHGRSRESAGREHGQNVKATMTTEYQSFSRFTHRTYQILLHSYGSGIGDLIWNDDLLREHGHSLPETVSQYLTILGSLILRFLGELKTRGGVDSATVDQIHQSACAVVDLQ